MKALDSSVVMTETIIWYLDLILVVVWIYTLKRRIGGGIQLTMSSHLYSAVDHCTQIVKHIMISDLQIMEEITIPGHVVCIYNLFICACMDASQGCS